MTSSYQTADKGYSREGGAWIPTQRCAESSTIDYVDDFTHYTFYLIWAMCNMGVQRHRLHPAERRRLWDPRLMSEMIYKYQASS